MNRILTWFLIALLFAMSGPLQAASMASRPGFRKSLYGRFAPWADKYAYCSGDPINGADPMGTGPGSEPGPDYDPNIPLGTWEQAFGDTLFAAGAVYEFWQMAAPAAGYGYARWSGLGARPTGNALNAAIEEGVTGEAAAAEGAAVNGNTRSTKIGNDVHYDVENGGTGQGGPSAFKRKYPETGATHARRFEPGADVTIKPGTKHPSSYPGSNWPKNANHADFKPANSSGLRQFRADLKSGKLPPNTVMLPYDPVTGEIRIP